MSHSISLDLEHVVRRVLKTDMGGFGHVAHADYIDMKGGAFNAIIAVLAPCYQDASSSDRAVVDEFIEKYRDLSDKKVSEVSTTVREMIDELKELVKRLY